MAPKAAGSKLLKSIKKTLFTRSGHARSQDNQLADPVVGAETVDDQHAQAQTNLHVTESAAIPQTAPGPGNDPDGTCSLGHDESKHVDQHDGLGAASPEVQAGLWSAAFAEAVKVFSKDTELHYIEGKTLAELFATLEDVGKTASKESMFLKGLKVLHSIQVPLEKFKLAIDLAIPVTSLEPTTTIVFGVVKVVTAVAISFASADQDFAKLIGSMLEQVSYIDDCDTLGQRTNRTKIHETLVHVYVKLLEFQNAAFVLLTSRGARLMAKILLEKDKLSSIVEAFLEQTKALHNLIQNATLEILQDIKEMLYDHEVSQLLGSDKAVRQYQYHQVIKGYIAQGTCDFMLHHPNFKQWLATDQCRQLYIFGDMGTGKTVMAAFLVEELRRRSQSEIPQSRVFYHYCRDDDTGDIVHILSCIILMLAESLPGLKRTFCEWHKEAQASGEYAPAKSSSKLQEFVHLAFGAYERPVFLIIDGLDECSMESRHRLLELMTTLTATRPGFKVAFTSRPDSTILVDSTSASTLNLTSDLARDEAITRYVVVRQLAHLQGDAMAFLIESLCGQAQGSAIWIAMTVQLIKVRRLSTIQSLRNFTRTMSLPDQLFTLYDGVLVKCTSNDDDNLSFAMAALTLLATARRPLSIEELAWATTLAVGTTSYDSIQALDEVVDTGRVISMIRPFISLVDDTDTKKRQVRLVHQSVKEYTMKKLLNLQAASMLSWTDNPEALILTVCLRYLSLDEINTIPLFSDEQAVALDLPKETDIFSDDIQAEGYDAHCTWEEWETSMNRYDPAQRGLGGFFVYASCHWVDHYGTLESGLTNIMGMVEKVCQRDSIRLDNWTKQNARPGCTYSQRFPFDSRLYDPLSITALYGSKVMLQYMLADADWRPCTYRSRSVVLAAEQILQWSDPARLSILLASEHQHELHGPEFINISMRQWHSQ